MQVLTASAILKFFQLLFGCLFLNIFLQHLRFWSFFSCCSDAYFGKLCMQNLVYQAKYVPQSCRKNWNCMQISVKVDDCSFFLYKFCLFNFFATNYNCGYHAKYFSIRYFPLGRQQRVVISDTKFSWWRPVKNGIHQGPVLGPFSFLFYISSMLEKIE